MRRQPWGGALTVDLPMSFVTAPFQRFRMGQYLLLSFLVLSACVAGGGWLATADLRQDRLDEVGNTAKSLAVVLREQTARSFQAVDLVIRETQKMVASDGVTTADEFRDAMGTRAVHRYLLERLHSLPQANSIALIDDTGIIVNFAHTWPPPHIDASDRDFFVYLRDHDDPGVFIGVPVVNRFTGKWTIMLSRRIDGPNKEFLGIVAGVIELAYFEEFYASAVSRLGESVSLFRRDGTLLARFPHLEDKIGTKLPEESPWYETLAKGGDTYRTPGYLVGLPRIVSVTPVPGYPLAITLGIAEDVALAPWRRQSLMIGVGSLGAILGFAGLFLVIGVQFGRLQQRTSALAQSEERCRDFALTSSDWFWETDTEHRITYVSEGIRALGQDPASRIGRNRAEFAANSDREPEKWRAHLAVLNRHEPFRDFAYTRKVDDQPESTITISGTPFFDASGRFLGYRGTGRDITVQVQAERALRDAKDVAESASRAKSQFLANMSHELRTPLNAILGFSEVLERGIAGSLNDRQTEYAGLIHQSGQHLHNIINDILDLAKVDAGKFELHEEAGVDGRQIAQASIALVRDHAETGHIRLSSDIHDDLPRLIADGTRLKQILLNLLSNAIKFTEPGGAVTLSVDYEMGAGVSFAVRDTGLGMSEGEIGVALEPFGQVDAGTARQYEGTGLGLPLARRLAELHGGVLAIRSEKGCGTTVTVTLPESRVMPYEVPVTEAASELAR